MIVTEQAEEAEFELVVGQPAEEQPGAAIQRCDQNTEPALHRRGSPPATTRHRPANLVGCLAPHPPLVRARWVRKSNAGSRGTAMKRATKQQARHGGTTSAPPVNPAQWSYA